ncbi:MAG: hypothetical protein QXX12_07380 [Nanopusillaceae archaeon]
MLGALGAIASILGIIGSAIGIYRALKPPKPPKIEIPKVDLTAIQQAIEQIKPISEQARQQLMQAIERYNRGELSPELKAKLDQAYQELYDKTMSALGQRGIGAGSSIYQRALQQLQQWYQQQYAQLLGQDLRNSLQLTGLATRDIDALLTKIGVQTQAGNLAFQNWALSQQIGQGWGQALAGSVSGLAQSLGQFADWYQNWQSQQQNFILPSTPNFRVDMPSFNISFWRR